MKAHRDWMVLRKIGYLKYSMEEVGWRVEGIVANGVVVIRSCRRPHVRKVA